MIRIMFVDDEHAVLEGLENRLRRFRKKWELSFCTQPRQAIDIIKTKPFDVVVSDMRMPHMDGAELLRQVRQADPRITRIVLSGQTGKDGMLRALPVAHQILSKPCAVEKLKLAVERGRSLNSVLCDERIAKLVASIEQLPVLSELYRSLTKALERPGVPLPELAAIIEQDVAMTARILQTVNSAFFSLGREFTSVEDAVAYLGINLIRSLVLSIEIFAELEQRPIRDGFCLGALQSHSLRTGHIAHDLIEAPEDRWTAFSASMLHDIGRLVLAVAHPRFYDDVVPLRKETGISLHEAEEVVHGFSHAEVGAVLLASWGLPYSIVEAVAHHHHPHRANEKTFGVVGAVHIADRLAHLECVHPNNREGLDQRLGLDTAYLVDVGAPVDIETWRLRVDRSPRGTADPSVRGEGTAT